MPVPAHCRVSLSGVFKNASATVEVWAFGINLTPRVFADEDERVLFATGVKDAWVANLAQWHRTNLSLTKVRVANVAPGGLVTRGEDGAYAQGDWLGDAPGINNSTVVMPLQTALCVSLLSARSGPRGRGRCFLPTIATGLGADYRYGAASMQGLADSFVEFLSDVRALDLTAGPWAPAVVSSFDLISQINEVRVGTVPDTMRSRRSDVDEAYVSSLIG